MTGTDLIVLAPWIAFAAGLAVICVLLRRSRRAPRPPADREQERRNDPQETRCQENNAQARPQ
jgi:hypothetical protein